ncbi:MAG: serpin family protein [Bacteroidia bacterium]|nr:serpin family protein [Bacteroidia bacterium]
MKTKINTILLALIFSAAGCSRDVAPVPEPEDIVMTTKSLQLVKADNTFTFSLFNKIPISPGKNVMVSPLSISLALSMALNGAEGTTKTDMINTLGLSGLSVDEINQVYSDLVTALKKADQNVVMNVANSIWIKKDYPVLEPFIVSNQKYYDASVQKLVFDLSAITTINNWVNEKTNTKIPTILDEISANEVLFLINAIYFNGKWQVQFEKSQTQDGSFTLRTGASVNVPLMKLKEKFGYSEQSGYKALKMPYGRGKFGMVILLPDVGKTADQIMAQMTPTIWETLKTSLTATTKVDVWLPRFKFTWESDLNQILSSLGMAVAFSESQANFSKINANDQLYITKVKHKTFVEVNEEGTEAAAVTSIGIGTTSIGPTEPEFHAIRPFLFFITEEDTGAILFAGKVENPILAK